MVNGELNTEAVLAGVLDEDEPELVGAVVGEDADGKPVKE